MVEAILVNGKIQKKKVLENLSGLIENMLDFILMIKKMDLEFFFGKVNSSYLLGFGKMGKNGFGKIITKNKIKYGLWKYDEKIKLFKNEKEAFIYLDNNKMNNYKNVFNFPKNKIIKFVELNYKDKSVSKLEIPNIFNEYLSSDKNG